MSLLGIDLVSQETMAKLFGVQSWEGLDQKTFRKIVSRFDTL